MPTGGPSSADVPPHPGRECRRPHVVDDVEDAIFVDPWPHLADGDGALRNEFTAHNLHLRGGSVHVRSGR